MFSLNEKIVYAGHGVARVTRIIEKKIVGQTSKFYELSFLSKDVKVLVPINSTKSVGIRSLSSREHIDKVFEELSKPTIKNNCSEFNVSNWNKRNKEYQNKLRSGSLIDLAQIYKDLKFISTNKELSFGEKNLLSQAEALLVEEISLIRHNKQEETVEHIRSLFNLAVKPDIKASTKSKIGTIKANVQAGIQKQI